MDNIINTTDYLLECPSCTHPFHSPFRQYDSEGKVLMGCVDECHTGHLTSLSESQRWHQRPEAKAIRWKLREGRVSRWDVYAARGTQGARSDNNG